MNIDADLVAELAAYDSQIDALREELAPLQARLGKLAAERQAYVDNFADQVQDMRLLNTLAAQSRVALRRLERHVYATYGSPIVGVAHEYAWSDAPEFGFLTGPSFYLDADALRNIEVADLTDRMVRFAAELGVTARVVVNHWTEQGYDLSGMVPVDITLDGPEYGPWLTLWYAPDGSRAVMASTSSHHYSAEGTLAEVLEAFLRAAKALHAQGQAELTDSDW